MDKKRVTEILKEAIIIERQSSNFYEHEALEAEHSSVSKIFKIIAEEEKKHEQSLLEEYKHFLDDGNLHHLENLKEHSELFSHVVSEDIKEEIKSASHESAALSAALGIERNAYELYSQRAKESDYQLEKELYEKLAIWEQDHIKFLSKLNRKIIQSAFFDGVE